MSGKGLPILEENKLSQKEQFEKVVRTFFERAWEEEESKLDPYQTALGRERVLRTGEILSKLTFQTIADLGCGNAPFASYLKDANVTAVDVAQPALNRCPASIKLLRQCLPYCNLLERSFDGVILTDVIADIEPHLHRLLLSEVSFIMKREGFFLCSTELDLYSEGPLDHFITLLQTEFEIIEMKKSYHRLYFYLRRGLDAPSRFVRASKESEYRIRQLKKRKGLFRIWFYCNSISGISCIWRPFIFLKNLFHTRWVILFLEKISKILWRSRGLTHVIVLCRSKRLQVQNK